MRPLLIGEAPALTTPEGWPPFFGRERSARRLWDLGFRVSQSPAHRGNVDAINLLDEYPGPRWPKKTAQATAHEMLFVKDSALRQRPAVILVGRNVADAFGVLKSWGWFEWFFMFPDDEKRGWPRFVTMPHPSGLNRWWNEGSNAATARAWCTGFLSTVDPGTLRGFGPVYGSPA